MQLALIVLGASALAGVQTDIALRFTFLVGRGRGASADLEE